MGFNQGRLEVDHPDLVYYTGQIISGRLVFDQQKNKSIRGIYIQIEGYCDIWWKTSHSKKVHGSKEHYTVEHTSHEVYCKQKVYVIGDSSGEVQINPGHYDFPFQFQIPGHCPSSFEGSSGQIRYEVKAVVDSEDKKTFKFDQEKTIAIRVVDQRDLNSDPYCKEPMIFNFEDTYCCWCIMNAGICEVTVKVPQSGYCPGQTINFEATCANNSNVEIDFIQFKLVEKRKFIAEHNHDTRLEEKFIAGLRKGPISGNSTRNWNLEIDIPQMDLYNVDACKFIDIKHRFKVIIFPSGCHSDTGVSRRIVIGHIPLREFDDGPPKLDVPTVNQPLQHGFPAVANQYQQSPYLSPNGYSSYPQHHKFPTPGQETAPNPPYPGGNTSVANAIPGQNPAYPGASSYPATKPPYPDSNSPYPGANLPYSSGPLPSVPPYPVGPDPYVPSPAQPGSSGRTENKDLSTVPLIPPQLPVTAHVPYPLNPSPFAAASAPEPSTPDRDEITAAQYNLESKKKIYQF